MARFTFFTDSHLSGKTPRHRIDDYQRALLDKLAEVYETASAEACDFVAFGGDFCNTHRIYSFDVIGEAIETMNGSGIPTYMCLGEHDLCGHSPTSYPTSSLAFIVRLSPLVHVITEPVKVAGVVIHSKHEWESVDVIRGIGREVDPSECNILICHELLTNKKSPFEIHNTADFADSPFDLVVSGDLHEGYSPHVVNRTWFCNPGSMARQKSNESHRDPQMAVIEIVKGSDPVIYIRKLKCAKPGDEVFGGSIVEAVNEAIEIAEETDTENFTTEMLKFEADSVDVHELIQNVGKSKGVRKKVLDYLATKKAVEV